MLTAEERQTYITMIRSLPDKLATLVQDLSPEQLTTAYLEGEWTVAQNVHHLVDMHMNSFLRLKAILTDDRPPMQVLKQDPMAEHPDASDADLSHSMMMLRGLHHRWATTFENMSDDDWQRVGLVRGTREITPDNLLEVYSRHGENHLTQIRETLAAAQGES